MSKKDLNLNINRDDANINDYLYCWSQFSNRPNKITLYNHYDPESFFKIINTIETHGSVTEVIPTGDDYLVNERSLFRIDQNIFISFSQFDKLTDYKIISDVSLFYTTDSAESVQSIISKLDECIIDSSNEDSQERFNTVYIGQSGLEIESINLLPIDSESIELYYNDDVFKLAKKSIKDIRKKNKGLTILFGERGTGKTHLINHIISNVDKMVIFIPSTMIEHTINNPDFMTILKRYQNSIIVIDDCESLFVDIYRKSTAFVNNMLQLIDGYQSDLFSTNFILSFNINKDELHDKSILNCNNLLSTIELGQLSPEKVEELSKHLGYKIKVKSSARLVDVVNKKITSSNSIELGFN